MEQYLIQLLHANIDLLIWLIILTVSGLVVGFRRIHRIRLSLDETHRKIRATDYQSAYDWSIGRGGGSFEWKADMGIVLFQYEHQRVYGLQLDDHGRPRPQLSYSYTFDLQEMKSPLIETITRAGWHCQPVAWQAHARLRWLLE